MDRVNWADPTAAPAGAAAVRHRLGRPRLPLDPLAAGLVSALLAMTGPVLILLQAAASAGFTPRQTVSWMFAVYVLGGLFSVVLPLRYRIPVTGAHSLTGVAYLAGVAGHFTYAQLVGAYLVSAAMLFLLGVTGVYARLLALVPGPVIAAMLAGLIAPFVARGALVAGQTPGLAVATLAGYAVVARWGRRLPPAAGAAVCGLAAAVLLHRVQPGGGIAWVWPEPQWPAFSVSAALAVSVPLAILVLGNDITPGLGALESFGFRPPVRALVTWSGAFSMATAIFGGHCANVAGMMTAICADESAGRRETRYLASVTSGVLLVLFGVFSFAAVPFIRGLPTPLMALLAGLSLLTPLGNSLRAAFADSRHTLPAVVTFAIALSNLTLFHVGAAVWALVAGCAVARLERRPG
ncbi:benzoate/H(+) symporter BenE family transporter [Alicyclobacillus sp.]|uniref:benzoate/H(+) symporter BenE family transporter n=1 Tax=Alicyclobacillus sp. TaxID=61169 RepID=UPI0025BD827F|nr:benzoate/H(+) symporter BenE family transporter [Alicyclobacillus sp.]MCL6518084.1 benzoate/H(+) symporter BenE family transporter [Alicyclobacillus sp.]